MIDQRTNEFASAASVEELKAKIPEDAQGPMFVVGETLHIKGWLFEVRFLRAEGMFLKPIGPVPGRQARRLRQRDHRSEC